MTIDLALIKEILAKEANKEFLTLYEKDVLAGWKLNQVDQAQAIEALIGQMEQQQAVMGTIIPPGMPGVTELSQISSHMGDIISGRFIAPSSAATSTEPTAAGFTGTAMSGEGETFGSDTYHIVGVSAGTLQFGLSASDGKAYAGAGAVILDTSGLTVQADETSPFVTFKDEAGDTVATIFQDGAGNLQIELADNTKALAINKGNVFINHATDTGGNLSFYENNVKKAHLGWGADTGSINIENFEGGNVYLIVKGAAASERAILLYDRTADVARFRVRNNGGFEILECATDPDYIDNYAIIYHLDTGAVKLRVKQGATETEITLHVQGTDTALGTLGTKNPPIDADKVIYRDSTASDALVTSTWTQVKAFLKTYFDGVYGGGSSDGWTATAVQPTRTAADDPTYTLSFASVDYTGLMQEGSPVKWTQDSIVRYGWVSAAPAFSTNTTMTVLTCCNNASTDYDVLDTGTYPITGFAYGLPKQPGIGMPINIAFWTVEVTDTTQRTKASPVQNTIYYSDFGSINITKPIGEFITTLSLLVWGSTPSGTASGGEAYLSTSSSSISDNEWGIMGLVQAPTGTVSIGSSAIHQAVLTGAKATHYVIYKTPYTGLSYLYSYNNYKKLAIRMRSAYL